MNRLVAWQVANNDDSRAAWSEFTEHRRRVTQLLLEARGALDFFEPHNGDSTPAGRLAVLGAGNCNDLDLSLLTTVFAEVHLVDLDGSALARATTTQPGADWQRIVQHSDVDLTGACEALAACGPDSAANSEEVQRVFAAVTQATPLLPAPFDVVASVCTLTQLFESIVRAVGTDHPCYLPLVQAVRARHLHLLVELTRPGGTAILVTDLVSSETAPDLLTLDDAQVPGHLAQLVENRNFFTGVNPAVLLRFFQEEPWVKRQTTDVKITNPWRWNLGPRTYAVFAIQVRRPAN